jgi:hypothetical protein
MRLRKRASRTRSRHFRIRRQAVGHPRPPHRIPRRVFRIRGRRLWLPRPTRRQRRHARPRTSRTPARTLGCRPDSPASAHVVTNVVKETTTAHQGRTDCAQHTPAATRRAPRESAGVPANSCGVLGILPDGRESRQRTDSQARASNRATGLPCGRRPRVNPRSGRRHCRYPRRRWPHNRPGRSSPDACARCRARCAHLRRGCKRSLESPPVPGPRPPARRP